MVEPKKRALAKKAGSKITLPSGYEEVLDNLRDLIKTAQLRAISTVNQSLISVYKGIGKTIYEQQQSSKPADSEKSIRIYYDEHGNKMIRSEGSRSWRNNNPGNLANFPFARENGSIGTDGRFAIFPDAETGQRVRKKLLKGSKYHHLTIKEMAYKYEPESLEKSEVYCKCIESRSKLGVRQQLNMTPDDFGLTA